MKEQAKVKCFVSRGRKHGAHRVHHHSGRCRLSRPHRAEDLLHHPHQTGGAVGWVWNMTSTGSRVLWAGSSFSVAPCWSIQGVSFTLSSSSSAGGKDGMVGFPDFIYKHIVPACFLAPLKPTFDLSDAQTVLVSFFNSTFNLKKSRFGDKPQLFFFFSGSVGVRSHTEDDSSQTGKNVFLWLTKLCYVSPRWTRAVFVSGTRIHPVLAAGVPAITPGGPGNFTGQKSLNPDVQKYLETCSFIYVQFYSFQSVSLFKYV